MECRNARLLLEFTRPGGGELDAVEAQALDQHLSECPECAALARAERRADEHLGRAIRDVPVPDGLRERILGKLAAERDAWYRRWVIRAGGIAAALLLVALVGWWLWPPSLPALTTADVPHLVEAKPRLNQDDIYIDFRKKVETELPPGFNYNLVKSYDLATLHGRQ